MVGVVVKSGRETMRAKRSKVRLSTRGLLGRKGCFSSMDGGAVKGGRAL